MSCPTSMPACRATLPVARLVPLLLLIPLTFASTPARAAGECLQLTPSMVAGTVGGGLIDVDARTRSDVWAVGIRSASSPPPRTYHWNGSSWAGYRIRSPRDKDYARLEDVSVVSANDVWAVGYAANEGSDRSSHRSDASGSEPLSTVSPALAVHWDGVAWRSSPLPSEMPGLYGVKGFASNDVWVAGGSAIGHWDGTDWSVVRPVMTSAAFDAIGGIGPNDLWALGGRPGLDGRYRTIAEHWDGAEWSTVPTPVLPENHYFRDVSTIASDDVWATGVAYGDRPGDIRGFVERWDGSTWRLVSSGPPLPPFPYVAALGRDDVWVGGWTSIAGGRSVPHLLHWNGSSWWEVEVPRPPSTYGETIDGLGGTAATGVWAIGSYTTEPSGIPQPLALGAC
jgi:hypothetical protein